jgi:hypothetical protein
MMRHTPGEAVHIEFLTTDGFLAPTLLNQLPEFRAAAKEDLLFVYVTAKSVN